MHANQEVSTHVHVRGGVDTADLFISRILQWLGWQAPQFGVYVTPLSPLRRNQQQSYFWLVSAGSWSSLMPRLGTEVREAKI